MPLLPPPHVSLGRGILVEWGLCWTCPVSRALTVGTGAAERLGKWGQTGVLETPAQLSNDKSGVGNGGRYRGNSGRIAGHFWGSGKEDSGGLHLVPT
ncbi:hypothetical protein B0T20DRAFT_417276 [Sordaria brevicollis]|uniref:Uncharacterized protein n=1 Tax=Sordaria brevicollis TaxID=83679 RepID=A0AAE0U9Y9_SORBR|nr:hypothetical protein B0T20DRAFT_417276 [Sordaria brevicollis]